MMLILLCIPVILWTFSLSRTMQTLKKTPLTVLLCLIVCFTLTSCFNTKNKSESVPDNYSLYSQYVDKVVKKFEPEGFEMLNSTADIYSSGFPENEYFEERDDLYDGNPLQPKNRKAVYLNSTNGILACMTFLYSEEELGKRMLTIDSLPAEAVATFQKEDDINIQETYEMVLEDQHCIVLIYIISLVSLKPSSLQRVLTELQWNGMWFFSLAFFAVIFMEMLSDFLLVTDRCTAWKALNGNVSEAEFHNLQQIVLCENQKVSIEKKLASTILLVLMICATAAFVWFTFLA